MKENQYLLVVNASNIDKDWNWISKHNDLGVDMKNISEDYSLLAIQGPKAVEAMQSLTSVDLSAIKYYHFKVTEKKNGNEVKFDIEPYIITNTDKISKFETKLNNFKSKQAQTGGRKKPKKGSKKRSMGGESMYQYRDA